MADHNETYKTYTLRTVADFVALDPSQIEACITDFRAWLSMVHEVKALEKSVPEIKLEHDPVVFGWIDDGKHVATLTFKVHGEPVSVWSNEFAPPELNS